MQYLFVDRTMTRHCPYVGSVPLLEVPNVDCLVGPLTQCPLQDVSPYWRL